jgi:hypothetical protein
LDSEAQPVQTGIADALNNAANDTPTVANQPDAVGQLLAVMNAGAADQPKGTGIDAPLAPQNIGGGAEVSLNGAQVQAALDIISKVAAGDIPRDSGLQSLQILFGLTAQQAERLMPKQTDIKLKTEAPNP